MKKLCFGIFLTHFFILFSGCGHIYAASSPELTHDSIEHLQNSASAPSDVSQSHVYDFQFRAPAGDSQENLIFDFLFKEWEEETEKQNSYKKSQECTFDLALHHWATVSGLLGNGNLNGQPSHDLFNHSAAPRFILFQVFRV
jgi:hypothetical protein